MANSGDFKAKVKRFFFLVKVFLGCLAFVFAVFMTGYMLGIYRVSLPYIGSLIPMPSSPVAGPASTPADKSSGSVSVTEGDPGKQRSQPLAGQGVTNQDTDASKPGGGSSALSTSGQNTAGQSTTGQSTTGPGASGQSTSTQNTPAQNTSSVSKSIQSPSTQSTPAQSTSTHPRLIPEKNTPATPKSTLISLVPTLQKAHGSKANPKDKGKPQPEKVEKPAPLPIMKAKSEACQYPYVKWQPKLLENGALVQLETTLDDGGSSNGTLKYKIRVLLKNKGFLPSNGIHFDMLDGKGFSLHNFIVSSSEFGAIPGTQVMEARGTTSLAEAVYQKAVDYAAR